MSGSGVYIKTASGLVAAATVPGPQGSQGPQSSLTAGPVTTGAAGTNAAATITGAGPVQTLNLTIPKGDPGGFTLSSVVSAPNLDTLTTSGLYYVTGAHTNSPVAGEAHVVVVGMGGSTNVVQMFTTSSPTGITYRRIRTGSGWGLWRRATYQGDIGSGDLTGTGSPEGVITAPIGTYYTDTAITNGAFRWAKKTGTGNTGWQCVEGDTGWRDVASTLQSGWTATAGALTLARRGNTVTLASNHNGLNPAAKTGSVFMFLPSGFRPMPFSSTPLNYRAMGNGFESGSETPRKIVAQSDGALTQGTATSTITFSISWSTGDPWPTSLPGAAA